MNTMTGSFDEDCKQQSICLFYIMYIHLGPGSDTCTQRHLGCVYTHSTVLYMDRGQDGEMGSTRKTISVSNFVTEK